MAIVSTQRQASVAEIVAEMDRRGVVIEALERELREVRQSNSELYRRAKDAENELHRRATPTPPAGGEANAADWLWFGEDETGKTHISFGRWQSHACQHRYKFADPQATEHDRPTPPAGDALREAVAHALHAVDCEDASEDYRRHKHQPPEKWADPWLPTGIRQLEQLRRQADIFIAALGEHARAALQALTEKDTAR